MLVLGLLLQLLQVGRELEEGEVFGLLDLFTATTGCRKILPKIEQTE